MSQFVSKEEFQRLSGIITKPASGKRMQHVPGQMNKTETKYAEKLELDKRLGVIRDWQFEAVKLKLAENTFYIPDFLVVMLGGAIEFHETKGHWEDDARVKWKVAKEKFPYFKFVEVCSR